MLIAYSAVLVTVMVFKDVPHIRIGPLMFNFGGTQDGAANLVPFKTILPYLLGDKGFVIAFINLAGNIVLLVPIGFLVSFIYPDMTWKKSLALAIAPGLAIEGMQAVLHVGIFDIDDVILNGLGVMVGYWAFTIRVKIVRTMKYKSVIITAVIVIAAVAMAAFYGVAAHRKSPQLMSFPPVAENVQPGSAAGLDSAEAAIPQGLDPCGGTGGTGQIVSVRNDTMTIKRNDGKNEVIYLTNKTKIKNSAGPLSRADLKTGYRVTVVVMEHHNATAVLVCNGQKPKAVN